MKLFRYRLFLLIALFFTTNCSDKITSPDDGGPYGTEKLIYDVAYSPNLIIITKEQQKQMRLDTPQSRCTEFQKIYH